jgi:SAM-dependent methyltransferase
MPEQIYPGTELDIFAEAVNWKAYLHSLLARRITGDVLEVGAGIGGTTRLLCTGEQRSWVCLEPDAGQAERLARAAEQDPFPIEPEIVVGTLADLDRDRCFDCILYVDVLEHIRDDEAEVRTAADFLSRSGCLAVVSPAHPFLYSEFDQSLGHFRRYTRRTLRSLGPPELSLEECFYVDAAGMLASAANRLVLKSGKPRLSQILFWDRLLVRCSRVLDPLTGFRLGKSVVAIWKRRQMRQDGWNSPDYAKHGRGRRPPRRRHL